MAALDDELSFGDFEGVIAEGEFGGGHHWGGRATGDSLRCEDDHLELMLSGTRLSGATTWFDFIVTRSTNG